MTNTVRIQLTPSRLGIARHGGVVHLDVLVTPPAAPTLVSRRPVAVALVIDRSGSMSSPALSVGPHGAQGRETPAKLDYVKQAARRMLELMPDGDAVTLVTFDDQVRVEKPLTVLSKQSRRALAHAVASICTGGSTNLDGGLRTGIEQLAVGGTSYSSRLVLLSDGLANVGEDRPGVLGEVAAGAAHDGITVSTLGVGVDYHLGLMSHLAECGNGAFHHIDNLADLEPILTSEFLDATAVTARNVEVTLRVPAGVAVGTNLSRLPQVTIDGGVRVALGDPVRPRDFVLELTTPVSLSGDTVRIDAMVEGLGVDGALLEAAAVCELPLLIAEQVEALPVDESVMRKVVERLQLKADMDASIALEQGDTATATSLVAGARASTAQLASAYGTALAERADVGSTLKYLDLLTSRLGRPESSAMLKSRFATASMASRGDSRLLGACPQCGEKAWFEAQRGSRLTRTCSACQFTEGS